MGYLSNKCTNMWSFWDILINLNFSKTRSHKYYYGYLCLNLNRNTSVLRIHKLGVTDVIRQRGHCKSYGSTVQYLRSQKGGTIISYLFRVNSAILSYS